MTVRWLEKIGGIGGGGGGGDSVGGGTEHAAQVLHRYHVHLTLHGLMCRLYPHQLAHVSGGGDGDGGGGDDEDVEQHSPAYPVVKHARSLV